MYGCKRALRTVVASRKKSIAQDEICWRHRQINELSPSPHRLRLAHPGRSEGQHQALVSRSTAVDGVMLWDRGRAWGQA